MSSPVDQIKAKLDIVTLVGGYVKLEKSGASFKGRCPFHNEKTPSFFVSPDRGNYYCFGCGAKGDIFTFVQEFEGLDFPGALKTLADRTGVVLEKFSGIKDGHGDDKQKLFSLTEQATFYFENKLSENVQTSNDARTYLTRRGLTKETISSFRIGYNTNEWANLHDYLVSKGNSSQDLFNAGLVKRRESGTGYYDTFRSRIIFPMADSSGRIVAFSGRIFPDDPTAPKYLNSPETPIFRKSEILFGLDKAKQDIRLRDYSILVEGQMDLVMLHQTGFTNTVASSGTALTAEHLVRLQRLSNRLIMAFDGDSAGFKAIVRGAEIALSLGMEVKVAAMPSGSDPADMALQDKEKLAEIIKDSKHVVSFVLDLAIAKSKDDREVVRNVVNDVLPFIANLSQASEQDYFVKEIGTRTGINDASLRDDLKKIIIAQRNANTAHAIGAIPAQPVAMREHTLDRDALILKRLIGILLWQESLSATSPPVIESADVKGSIASIVGTEYLDKCIDKLSQNKDMLVFEAEAYYASRDNLIADIAELVLNLHEETLKKRFAKTMTLLQQAGQAKDSGEEARLLGECHRISQELSALKTHKQI
jgi:DNA primase